MVRLGLYEACSFPGFNFLLGGLGGSFCVFCWFGRLTCRAAGVCMWVAIVVGCGVLRRVGGFV